MLHIRSEKSAPGLQVILKVGRMRGLGTRLAGTGDRTKGLSNPQSQRMRSTRARGYAAIRAADRIRRSHSSAVPYFLLRLAPQQPNSHCTNSTCNRLPIRVSITQSHQHGNRKVPPLRSGRGHSLNRCSRRQKILRVQVRLARKPAPPCPQLIHCRPDTETIPNPTLRSIADSCLGLGETIFDMIQASAVNSEYFKKDSRR